MCKESPGADYTEYTVKYALHSESLQEYTHLTKRTVKRQKVPQSQTSLPFAALSPIPTCN